jgi:hypothetical protein
MFSLIFELPILIRKEVEWGSKGDVTALKW